MTANDKFIKKFAETGLNIVWELQKDYKEEKRLLKLENVLNEIKNRS